MTASPASSASVVVPTHNKARFLEMTLASFRHQTAPRFEIVVVDDGSTDTTPEVVERNRGELPIRYIHQRNRGRASARNAGLAACTGDVVIFSDDDRIVPATFVEQHLAAFQGTDDRRLLLGRQRAILTWWFPGLVGDERLASLFETRSELRGLSGAAEHPLVTPRDVEERRDETIAAYDFPETWWEKRCTPVLATFSDLGFYRLNWTLGTTGNMSTTRRLLAEVGPFDEAFERWGLEDTELCYRLTRAGARVDVAHEAVNYHQVHPSSPHNQDDWNRNYRYFAEKFQYPLDILLYLLVVRGKIDFEIAHRILEECEWLSEAGRPLLVDELTRQYCALAARLVDDPRIAEGRIR